MSLAINKKKKPHWFQQSEKCGYIFYFLLLDFYSNNFATVIFQHHMFTFTRVLLFSSCWWRGCRDAHRFTSQLMKTTSCDATEYCRETTQNTRLTLLFSYLRFLFLNVYRANLSLSLSGRVRLGLCCRLLAERQTQRQQQKQKQWSVLAAKNFSLFSLYVWLREADRWLGRETCWAYRETERERAAAAELQTHFKLCVSGRDVFYWKGLSELFDQKWRHGRTVSRPPGPSSEQNKHTLGLGIDPLWFSF